MKKLMALALTLILALGCLGAFAEETTEIYFLNFKPEIAEVYEEIAATYEAETGVHVNVVTAAAGTYEQTLRSEIAKADAPTIFQINGPVGLQSWKDYCLDLADTEFYNMLSDKTLAVTEGDAVYGIPYVVPDAAAYHYPAAVAGAVLVVLLGWIFARRAKAKAKGRPAHQVGGGTTS